MIEMIPFFSFDGNCREAMLFYKDCLGGELFLLPLSDTPIELDGANGGVGDRIMHATLTIGSGTAASAVVMAADTMPGERYRLGNNVTVMLQCESIAQIETLYALLSEEGTANLPLQDTFWGARFGMLTDRYGIHWRLQFAHPKEDLGL